VAVEDDPLFGSHASPADDPLFGSQASPADDPLFGSQASPKVTNLADAVRRSAIRDPGASALIAHDAAISWGELDSRIDAVAAGLATLDLPTNVATAARVALALPNVPEFAVAFFAVLRAGLVAVPVNPGYTARELHHVLRDSGASVIIATPAVLDAVSTVRADLPALQHAYTVGGDGIDGAPPFALLAEPPDAGGSLRVDSTTGGEDLAVLLYTSGTAGAPKGAMLSHRALIANHHQVERVSPPIVEAGDVVLLALPLFHAFGLNSGLGAVAWHGACGVLAERFDPAESLRLIARHHVSVVAAVPQMYVAWSLLPDLGESLASVRVAVSGAAPLDASAARRFLEATRHPVFEGYGLTETAPVVTTALASPVPKTGSIGRPIPDMEVKLVGADGAEIARVGADGLLDADQFDDDFDDDAGGVPGTDPGEIVVRGPNLFSGYWPDGAGGPDPEGWWATGDVAYADADGDLFLVDRLGELILVSGFNVYPREVELVLAGHPGVAEAAVVGIEHPYTGQAVKAYVVPAPGGAPPVEELIAHCERNLARFKCPGVIEFVPELTHSATGKVRKGMLRGRP
jgi:long-chain acyl-CoA synthetase